MKKVRDLESVKIRFVTQQPLLLLMLLILLSWNWKRQR